MNAAANANDAFNSINDIADEMKKNAPKSDKKDFKRVSAFGFLWRAAAIMLVFIGLLMAISFGMQFGMAYIAGLGLGETLTLVLHIMVQFFGVMSSVIVGWFTGKALGGLIGRRIITKVIDAFDKKEAAAA